ncbi:hypothetical protein [Hyphomonas johnsonii]|jgi:cell division septation protein DedD|nr:hypothetical protein [Hyphomonas johnsonii]
MYQRVKGGMLAVAASVVILNGPAEGQDTARTPEAAPVADMPLPKVVSPRPLPTANTPAPVSVPSRVIISPPAVCRIRSENECHHEAAACLTARGIDDLYDVSWKDGRPVVIHAHGDGVDVPEDDARGCATDLQLCLSASC